MLLYSVAKDIIGIWLISHIIKEEQDRWLQCLGKYSFHTNNVEKLSVAAFSTVHYGHALDLLLHKIVFLTETYDWYNFYGLTSGIDFII